MGTQNVNKERILHNSHPLQQDFLLSTFKGILYHFFFLGRSRSRFVDLFSFPWSSSLVSLKEPLFLFLLELRFIGGATVYDACISFLCLRSSSICKTNIRQDSSKMQLVIISNYQYNVFASLTHCLNFLCVSTGHLCKLCQNLSTR